MASNVEAKVITGEIVRAFGLATRKQAEELLRRAKLEVPVGMEPESGTGTAAHPPGKLRDSGKVERLGTTGWQVSFNTPYAKKQHEAQQFKHPQGGKAKYLEDPLKAMIATMAPEIAEDMQRVLATTIRDPKGRFARAGDPGAFARSEVWRGGGALLR